jgi:hypothetical protein
MLFFVFLEKQTQMKSVSILVFFSLSLACVSQNLSSDQLLENAIKYHDPNGHWNRFNDEFTVIMTTPKDQKRTSVISINLPKDHFSIHATRDTVSTTYTLDKGACKMTYNTEVVDSLAAEEKNMNCERGTLYKNYYTYLYGLPMKLKDPGTNLGANVEKKTFQGKEYLVLKVTYDKAVGSDVWYFYFNPKTFAMDIYQFFKTDGNGKEKPESGEYILLSGEAVLNGIKIPKIRAWYFNKDDTYLGTDVLELSSKDVTH